MDLIPVEVMAEIISRLITRMPTDAASAGITFLTHRSGCMSMSLDIQITRKFACSTIVFGFVDELVELGWLGF